jgi:hypothetical protein
MREPVDKVISPPKCAVPQLTELAEKENWYYRNRWI